MNTNYDELPDWAKNMTGEKWESYKKEEYSSAFNCEVCGKRLLLTMCDDSEAKHYCYEHCPEHLWQSDNDWPTECARCAVNYSCYLEDLLEKNNIPIDSKWKEVNDS